MSASRGSARYVRTVERLLAEYVGDARVFSPRDFALAADWHARGVPLEIVREALDAHAARARGAVPLRALAQIAAAVDEAFAALVDGRARGRSPACDRSPARIGAVWDARRAAEPQGSALGELLGALAARLARGESVERVDAELDARLSEVAAPELRAAVEREVDALLDDYADRMPPDRLAVTRRRAVCERLRQRLGLASAPLLES